MITLQDPSLLRERCYIDGEWVGSDDWETRRAIAAAALAQPSWAALTAKARGVLLQRWFKFIPLHRDDLAVLMTAEQGKPPAESRSEVLYAASYIEWFAEGAKRLYGDVIPGPQSDNRILVLRKPVGVDAAIARWNFPAAMVTRKTASESEAIAMANDTEFALAAYSFTRDLPRSWRVSEAIEAGVIGINTGLISTEIAPFGGVKESGMGREGSRHGMLDYTEIKYMCVSLS